MLISFHARAVSSPQCLALWKCLEISHIGLHITVPDRHSRFSFLVRKAKHSSDSLNKLPLYVKFYFLECDWHHIPVSLNVLTAHLAVNYPLETGRVIP